MAIVTPKKGGSVTMRFREQSQQRSQTRLQRASCGDSSVAARPNLDSLSLEVQDAAAVDRRPIRSR